MSVGWGGRTFDLTRVPRGKSNSFGVPYDRQPDDTAPTEDELVQYGEDTWEVSLSLSDRRLRLSSAQSILKYMVSSGLSNGMNVARPRNSVLQLLLSSGLMADM